MQKINHAAAMELLTKLQIKLDYDGGADPIYIGRAHPEAATSELVWQIQKLTYSSGNITAVQYAGGTPNPEHVWDNRASLSYS